MKQINNKKVAYARHRNGMLYQILSGIEICKRKCGSRKTKFCYGFMFRANCLTNRPSKKNEYRRLYSDIVTPNGTAYCRTVKGWDFLTEEEVSQLILIGVENEKS